MQFSHRALAAIAGAALLAGTGALWQRERTRSQDALAWATLGRAHAAHGRFAESSAAYAQAAALRPKDAQLLADYADAQAMTQGRRLRGTPEALIARALELGPENVKALSLYGSLLYEKGDYAGAAEQWRRLLPLVPAGSDFARVARERIEAAERRSGARP